MRVSLPISTLPPLAAAEHTSGRPAELEHEFRVDVALAHAPANAVGAEVFAFALPRIIMLTLSLPRPGCSRSISSTGPAAWIVKLSAAAASSRTACQICNASTVGPTSCTRTMRAPRSTAISGRRDAGRHPLIDRRGRSARQASTCARYPTSTGRPSAANVAQAREQRQIVRQRLAETEPGIDQQSRRVRCPPPRRLPRARPGTRMISATTSSY